ncbi:MAG: HD domain-containing protein [Hadesarchaea archaeon]|nr:HD domain-containing protein [Hadesarchaea archaeon]
MFVKHVRDPIFGYIGMTDVEKNIIDTRPVQRLRGIKQLSIAHITYPGGVHTRFSHALGTMHLAGKMGESLRSGVDISDDELQLIRLAGLLHDIGHGPFSHSYEGVLSEDRGMTHEDVGKEIVEDSVLADEIEAQGYEPEEVSDLVFGESKDKPYLKQIVASQVDADKMDFLLRDAYFTGVEYGQIDVNRLIQAMDVVENDLAIDMKALYALEAFMIARYEMFLAVYYHHAVRAAEIMLRKALEHSRGILNLTNFDDINEFFDLDDAYVMTSLRKLDPSDYEGEEKKNAEKAKETIEKLDRRELLKSAYRREVHLKDEYVANLLGDESVRHDKEKKIAEKASVDPEYVTVDVPTLTSMPYYPREIDPMEVPVFRGKGEEKELVPLSEYSRLVNVLKGYIDIIRVFTLPEYREEVGEAGEEVFKELPFSAQISM